MTLIFVVKTVEWAIGGGVLVLSADGRESRDRGEMLPCLFCVEKRKRYGVGRASEEGTDSGVGQAGGPVFQLQYLRRPCFFGLAGR